MEEQKEVVVREGSAEEKFQAEIEALKTEIAELRSKIVWKDGMIEGLKYAVRGREEGWTGTN